MLSSIIRFPNYMSILPEFTSIKNSKKALNDVPATIGVYVFRGQGTILYVGKATNLKARLRSHLENAKQDPKEHKIISEADSISYGAIESDFRALLVESELIQKHHPKYNVRWRDDKSYLYIKITVKDEYPKVLQSRRENDGKSRYFGPFPGSASVTDLLRVIRRIIPFCTQKRVTTRPCFYSKIGFCNPCPNYIQGKEGEEKKQLKKKYRHNIRQIIKILDGKFDPVLKELRRELDALTSREKFEEAIQVRNRLLKLEYLLSNQIFLRALEELSISPENSLIRLQKILQPFFGDFPLARIECYDISNFAFKESTASMVVATEGFLNKAEYRKFKIKNLKLNSDFAMIEETVRRRFFNKWPRPDLIIIDGGKPQVRTLIRVLGKLHMQTPVVGLAKRPDRLVIGVPDLPTIRPSLSDPGFNLLRLLRDESHRFARRYHLTLRGRKLTI